MRRRRCRDRTHKPIASAKPTLQPSHRSTETATLAGMTGRSLLFQPQHLTNGNRCMNGKIARLIPKLFAGQLTTPCASDMLRLWIFQFSKYATTNWVKSGSASTFTHKDCAVPLAMRVRTRRVSLGRPSAVMSQCIAVGSVRPLTRSIQVPYLRTSTCAQPK